MDNPSAQKFINNYQQADIYRKVSALIFEENLTCIYVLCVKIQNGPWIWRHYGG